MTLPNLQQTARSPAFALAHSLAGVILLGASAASAQEEKIKLELLTVAVGGSGSEYYFKSHGKIASLQAFETGIGSPIEYLGNRTLALYKSKKDLKPRKDGEKPPPPLATVRLPKTDRALLVFSFADRKKSTVPKLRAFSVSTSSLKEGDYRLFNFSTRTVFASIGDRKRSIASGKVTDLSSAAWRRGVIDMPVKFGITIDGKARPIYSSVWGHRPERRMFLFIFDRPDRNRPLDVRRFYDVPSIKAPPVKAGKRPADR